MSSRIRKFEISCCVMKNQVSMQKIDSDNTGTIKLILWEQVIDSVHSGLSYQFNNLTICIFDEEKLRVDCCSTNSQKPSY